MSGQLGPPGVIGGRKSSPSALSTSVSVSSDYSVPGVEAVTQADSPKERPALQRAIVDVQYSLSLLKANFCPGSTVLMAPVTHPNRQAGAFLKRMTKNSCNQPKRGGESRQQESTQEA